jgi:glycine cleavage system aminomethyltransferase T
VVKDYQCEHLAMRDQVAMIDLSAFAVFDLHGPAP